MESIKTNKPVIFCVNCGSTNLDQNSVSQIQCYDCGNEGIWSGQKFGIAKDGDPHYVISSIMPPADPFYFADWRSQMLLSLEEFFQSVDSTVIATDDMITNADYQKLLEEWKRLQNRIELFLRAIKITPEEE
ncbi:MAG TPA: hypothetical protein VK400_04200, partial [Pyrinomonadaceae bacterium]|nr:hypothetical protein [Pyrinomonadaceae bacterium]